MKIIYRETLLSVMLLHFIQTIGSMILSSLPSSATIKEQPTSDTSRIAKKQLASSKLSHH